MNSKNYIDLLDEALINMVEDIPSLNDQEWIFQQDNAAIHVSNEVKNWFQERQITTMEWPACSADLNPIENLWGILVRDVYKNGRQFQKCEELKDAIRQAWKNIRPAQIQTLVNSMPNRIFDVILHNGMNTNY